jgi:protein involved in plasmid replication-relaxation
MTPLRVKTVPDHKSRKNLLILTAPREKILRAAHFYRFLLTTDICRLYWSLSSLTYVRDLLANLAKHKYLYRFAHPTLSKGGSENTYTLGCKGREYVERILGLPVEWTYKPHKLRHASYGAVLHNLILSRTLIAASLWAKKQPNFKLLKTYICYELARKAPSIEITNGKGEHEKVKVIPDAYLLFQKLNNNKHERFYEVLIEIDRGTEFKQRLVKSIQARLEFVKDHKAYSSLFGTTPNNVIIAYITTGDRPEYRATRRKAMCEYTRQILAQYDHNNLNCCFRFCSVVASEIYNIPLFEGAGWFKPGESSPVSLFTP